MRAPRILAGRSFRTRLTATITGVFVLAGVALVAVVYLLMTGLLRGAIDSSGHTIAATQMTGTLSIQAARPAGTVGADGLPPDFAEQDTSVQPVTDPQPTGPQPAGPERAEPAGTEPAGTGPEQGATGFAGIPRAPGALQDSVMIAVNDASTSSTDLIRANTVVGAAPLPTEWLPGQSLVQMDSDSVGSWFVTQSEQVADDVRGELLLWSGVALVIFAGAAAAIAAWLSRRAMRRIGEVTAMTKDMSTHDLHRRLDLRGPEDEIKELADTIDDMLNRLEESFSARERFIANASHELRTPLTTARAALEIPLTQGRVPDQLMPAVQTALRAGRTSEQLITALLSLAKGATTGERIEVDLADVVPAAVAERLERTEQAGIRLELTSASAAVDADPVMASQAVGNLLDNAIRYNVPDGEIRVDVTSDADESTITVENTGRVLDPEVVELLAEPFYRAESSRTAADDNGHGAGLGLSIVRSICLSHGGRLELAARDGGGLVATIVLPRRVADSGAAPDSALVSAR